MFSSFRPLFCYMALIALFLGASAKAAELTPTQRSQLHTVGSYAGRVAQGISKQGQPVVSNVIGAAVAEAEKWLADTDRCLKAAQEAYAEGLSPQAEVGFSTYDISRNGAPLRTPMPLAEVEAFCREVRLVAERNLAETRVRNPR